MPTVGSGLIGEGESGASSIVSRNSSGGEDTEYEGDGGVANQLEHLESWWFR